MSRIFINYRREDLDGTADRVKECLEINFGKDIAFLDKTMEHGKLWPQSIKDALNASDVVLCLIGNRWFKVTDEFNKRRIDNSLDWVRLEIEEAIRQKKNIIPVLFDTVKEFENARAYPENSLLPQLREFKKIDIRQDWFPYDVKIMIEKISDILGYEFQRKIKDDIKISETDILKDLPLPPELAERIPVGDSPYVGLRPFSRDDAQLFFGRNKEIYELYKRISGPVHRLCLLYGKSGVGKSSLLFAGLFPRLEREWSVYYHRRSKELALGESLIKLVKRNSDTATSNLIMLDQVEEIFTDPNPEVSNEAADFFQQLDWTLENYPQVRIVLGFRSEFYVEIIDWIRMLQLPASEFLLKPLNQEGILEAALGVTKSPLMTDTFKLEFEEGLPEVIAADILKDRVSHIGPVLQIQLSKLWSAAVEQKAYPYSVVHITRALYEAFYQKNLGHLLDAQLNQLLDSEYEKALKNGLVIDLLYFFTTSRETAASFSEEVILNSYEQELTTGLILRLKRLHLLNDDVNKGSQGKIAYTRLAHDALAPLVRERFNDSDAVGQRALRIVEAKRKDIENGLDVNFSKSDIEVIKIGKPYMRRIPDKVQECIVKSEDILARREAEIFTKTSFIFDTLLTDANNLLDRIEFFASLGKVKKALDLEVSSLEKKKKLEDLLIEIAFFFSESRQNDEIARETINLLQSFPQSEEIIKAIHRLVEVEEKLSESLRAFLLDWKPALMKYLNNKYYPELLEIEGGIFKMGTDDEESDEDEKPPHDVEVSTFGIATTPVTFWQFGLFCTSTNRKVQAYTPPWGRNGNHPVVLVNWEEAVAYTNWLSRHLGYEPVYEAIDSEEEVIEYFESDSRWTYKFDRTKNGFRLPTEAEWEFAAKGGNKSKGYAYSGSDNIEDVAWYKINSGDNRLTGGENYEGIQRNNCKAHPVKSKQPNELGLYDFSGNVWEWCWDKGTLEYYQHCFDQGKVIDPSGPTEGTGRIIRGGSWFNVDYMSRICYRESADEVSKYFSNGFRIAKNL